MEAKIMKRSIALLMVVIISMLIVSCSTGGGIGEVEFNPYALFMNFISDGDFWMGDTRFISDEGGPLKPQHHITLTYDFYMQRLEVTNAGFLEFLNDNPVTTTGWMNGHQLVNMGNESCEFAHVGGAFQLVNAGKANYPVHNVSWWGAIEYCNWMSREYNLDEAYNVTTGQLITSDSRDPRSITQVEGFRLPTEAEWEYAARGAENDYLTPRDFLYAGGNTLDSFGWYRSNCYEPDYPIFFGGGTHLGGGKNPNEKGLFDMSGNVEEWCHDWYSETYYSVSPSQNPTGPITGTRRAARGGSWYSFEEQCINFTRNSYEPSDMEPFIGFRMVKIK